jgi:hypothetical protein
MALRLVDTMAAYSDINYDMPPALFFDHYPVVPSLHFGGDLPLAVAILRSVRNPLVWAFGLVMPIATTHRPFGPARG